MTFEKALPLAIDYGKFIVQLWNYYIVLVVAMIGWLVTLRSKTSDLDRGAQRVLIGSYLLISVIFSFVLEQNHAELIKLMRLVHSLAQADPKASDIYGPNVDPDIIRTLHMTSRVGLPFIAILVALFIWFLTKQGPNSSGGGQDKTET
jgi:hypothetical protein